MAQKAEAKAKDAAANEQQQGAGVAPGNEVDKAAATNLAELRKMQEADAGAGFEEATSDAYAIPFLYILQSNSPQVKKSDGAYIQGAEEGMFYNTVTGDIYNGTEGGVILVPCHFAQRYIEWKPRESGGGFIQEHPPTSPLIGQTVKDEKNRDKLPNGNNLVDTRNHYCLLILPNQTPQPIVVSMSSTQVKKSRNWMSKMNGLKMQVGNKLVQAPMFSRRYRATTVPEKNDQGSWFGWKIELLDEVKEVEVYTMAKEFKAAVQAGRAKAVQPQPDAEEEIAA